MKYARITKKRNSDMSFVVLVAFKNKQERDEQELRFGYEFPDGDFVPVDYDEARHEFKFRSERDFNRRIELCDGKEFPAMLTKSTEQDIMLHETKHRILSWICEDYGGAVRI